jgi:hypothetical protein
MTTSALPITDLTRARHDIVTSSAGGAPFLICFGATIALAGLVWPLLPVKIAALVVMFQGNLALPAAFWLERRMGWTKMAADNPLKSLSIQLAMSQIVAFPAVIVAYALSPAAVPVTLAAIAGGHFLPYSWLQRTPVYIALAIAVSAGAFAIQVALGAAAPSWILLFMSACYWVGAAATYRAARRLR